MTKRSDFMTIAQIFNKQTGIDSYDHKRITEWRNRFEIIEEEVDELEEVLSEADESTDGDIPQDLEAHAVEELTDILVTCFTCAGVMDVDIEEAYLRKMEYNMGKSGDKVVDGKVQDDSDRRKPRFDDLVGGAE